MNRGLQHVSHGILPSETGGFAVRVFSAVKSPFATPRIKPLTCAFALLVFVGALLSASVALAIAPDAPTEVVATAGTRAPVIAHITWLQPAAASGFRLWRSKSVGGGYQILGSTVGESYDDVTGLTGQAYYYRVSAYNLDGEESVRSDPSAAITAVWTPTPHGTYASADVCDQCHAMHTAKTYQGLLREPTGGGTVNEVVTCFTCHDGTGASGDIKNGADSFSSTLLSGHTLEALVDTATPTDLTNACSSCHDQHADPTVVASLYSSRINTTTADNVTGRNNTWCLACHNDTQDWYKGTYPSLASPSRDASGYPTLGTFPGRTAYSDGASNAHLRLPVASAPATRVAGDCLYCHAAHRSASKYDSLVATFSMSTSATVATDHTEGTFAALCFTCHGGGSWEASGAVNIKQFVASADASDAPSPGHRITTGGGTLPVGAPLPCYDCHNPHGSSRGNAAMLSDALGGSLEVTTAAGVRHVCLSCHSTRDAIPQVWDSGSATYIAATPAMTVEGLQRNGGTHGSGAAYDNKLRLPDVTSVLNGHLASDTQSCELCHGSDYSSASARNVHSPRGGGSPGGLDCYECHSGEAVMEDSLGTHVGTQNTTAYHHVLGGTVSSLYKDGSEAFAAGSYPTLSTTGSTFCLSCHVDHDKFNANRAANLRADETSANPIGVATDFSTSTSSGVCTGCHAVSLTKNTTEQKSDGSTHTPTIVAADFTASAHSYAVDPAYGDGTLFYGNCVKCHNDEQPTPYQTQSGPIGFSSMWSQARSLLSAFGGAVTDPMSAVRCLACHSRSANGLKVVANKEYYRLASMDTTSQRVYDVFNLGGSSHPIAGSAGASVKCENCHNPHIVNATNRVSNPANTYSAALYTTPAQRSTFCLTCHAGNASLPAYSVSSSSYVPTMSIPTTHNVVMNKSTNASRGHWTVSGSIACDTCHDKHGSPYTKLLGIFNPLTGASAINGAAIAGDDNSVCYACHSAATTGWPDASRNASGYPTAGAWPASSTYTAAYNPAANTGSMHTTASATWPGMSYAGGDCKNCHDVHGTANTYDELRTEDAAGVAGAFSYSPSNFSFCFNCHAAGGPGIGYISRYYPTTAGGVATQTASTNYGHKTHSAGNLPAGSATPCYDCHNPHGSASAYGLQVTTRSNGATITVGDTAGELAMSTSRTAADIRHFCFTCHTTSDTAKGWTGSTMATALAGDTVEGISRVTTSSGQLLRLVASALAAHTEADTTTCYACHLSDYSSHDSYNVHNPTTGLSAGGQDCYVCHARFQDPLEDSLGAKVGDANTTYYHMVLGDLSHDGDYSDVTAGGYPAAGQSVFCLSCHVDHDKFNANKAANLRSDMTTPVAGQVATNTDFIASGSGGVCLSCHTTALVKDTTQAPLGASSVTPSLSLNAYTAATTHNYVATSTFTTDGSTYRANCVKCHCNATVTAGFSQQNSTYRFMNGWASTKSILAALGVASPPADYEESFCYNCHSVTADGYKSFANRDWYNIVSMSTTSQAIYQLFSTAAPQSVTTTSTLYFKPTTETMPVEPMTNVQQTGDTYVAASTWVGRTMAPNPATVAYETKSVTINAGTLFYRMVSFTSPAVTATTTVAAGTWTINAYASESGGGRNLHVRSMIYKWNANDTIGTTVVAKSDFATEVGTVVPGTGQVIPVSGGVVTLNTGDKITVDLVFSEAAGTAGTAAMYWGSGAPGSLVLPQAVGFNWATSGTSGHFVGSYAGIHLPSSQDETQGYISRNKHVECADCHNVHAAQPTRHTQGTNAVSGTLAGVSGEAVTPSATNWTVPTYSWVQTATAEYQICFKCHSGANTNVTSWGGAAAGSWTDVGLEFSTANQSYHPVVAALPLTDPSATYGSSQLTSADMRATYTNGGATYTKWTNGATMYCSDCHAQSNAGSLGPHGSSVEWLLKGPNQAWPYRTAVLNGTNGAANFRTIATAATGADTQDGLFCNNCHALTAATHSANHTAFSCVNCHVRIPHGGKVSRLIAAANQATYPGNLPNRESMTGDGLTAPTGWVRLFIKGTPYTAASVRVSGTGCTGGGCHSTTTPTTGEGW